MVRVLIDRLLSGAVHYIEAAGISADTKPSGVATGSKFIEVDTGIEFAYDEESGTWCAKNTGNGKTSIAGATVTLGSAVTYDGTQKTKTVSSVKVGTATLNASTDYMVNGNTGTEIGDYTLYIIGTGSYTGVIPEAWSIGQGTGSVTASPDTLSLTAEGDAGTSTLTVVGDGEVTVASSDDDVASAEISGTTVTVTPLAAGSATVTATLAGTEHYSGATDTIAVTVSADDG